jgi:hypothetical protein
MRFPACILLAVVPLLGQETFTLPAGLTVKLFENHERPFVEARLEVVWEGEDERGGLEGAGAFLGAVLGSGGAGPYSPAAWRKALDEQGILMRFEARPGRYIWTIQCPSATQEAAFEFLAHAVARPLLDGPSMETQRGQLSLEGLRKAPSEWAEERFRWELLEGRPEGLLNKSRLAALSLELLQVFQSRVLRPGRAMLALHGDLVLAQARQLSQLHLGIWGPVPRPRLPVAIPAAGGPPLAGLALAQGRPEARLALLAPDGAEEEVALLPLLLDRWIQHPAAAPPGFEGKLIQTGKGPCLLLQASGPVGADPLQLLGGLRSWAEALVSRPLGEEDLTLARRLRASREAAAPLHPSRQLEASFHPATSSAAAGPAALQACLARWLAPDRMRVLLLGIPALPKDGHPALKGLGPVGWVKPRD